MAAVAAMVMTGCKKEPETVRVFVADLEMNGDTLISLHTTNGADSMIFALQDVQFSNGVPMHGDSVAVTYMEKGDDLKALMVTVLPKPIHYLEVDKDAPLLTR